MQKDSKLLNDQATKSNYVAKPEYQAYKMDFIRQINDERQYLDDDKLLAMTQYLNQIKIDGLDLSTSFFTDEQFKFLFSQHFKLLATQPENAGKLRDITGKFMSEIAKRMSAGSKTVEELLQPNFDDYISNLMKIIPLDLTESQQKFIQQIVGNKIDFSDYTDEEFKPLLEMHQQLPKTTESFHYIDKKLTAEANKRRIKLNPSPNLSQLLMTARIPVGANCSQMK